MKNFHRFAAGMAGISCLFVTACQHSREANQPSHVEEMAAFHGAHEQEIREILMLARMNEWEEARLKASGLYALDPGDPRVERIYQWVNKEAERRSARAIETELADISAQEPRFSPTMRTTFLEPRRRGVPLSSDLREAVEDIDGRQWIPDTYGEVVQKEGPLVDVDQVRNGRMAEILDKRITMQLNDVTLESIIFNVGRAQGINFIADRAIPAFQQTLSVNMSDIQLREFLRFVSRNMGVQFQVGEDIIWIVDGANPANRLEETRFFRLRRGFIKPAEFGATEISRVTERRDNVVIERETQELERFVRDAAPPQPSLQQAIATFFTGSSFLIDYERNVIVARGTHEELEVLERIIEEFDREVQQVLIEARFITVSRAAFLQLGMLWETGRPEIAPERGADFTGFGTDVGVGIQETFRRILDRDNLSATLTAIEQSGEGKTLSAPRITLINNRPATIRDGKVQYYYEEYTVSQTILQDRTESTLVPRGRPTRLKSGVSLDVLASIGGDGQSIMLALRPKVSQDVELVTFAELKDVDAQGRPFSRFAIRLPQSRDQELSTRVVVRSGQTIVMGGVIEHTETTFTEAVPFLGNLPIIGAAFRRRTELLQPRYLLIFVTATRLSETGEFIEYVNVN